jgi:hypothetical protein
MVHLFFRVDTPQAEEAPTNYMNRLHCIGPLTAEQTNEHTITRACQFGRFSNRDAAIPEWPTSVASQPTTCPSAFGRRASSAIEVGRPAQ